MCVDVKAVALMTDWLRQHQDNPYPNDDEKEALIASTRLTMNQINYWFTNARRRLLPKWTLQRQIEEQDRKLNSAAGTQSSSHQAHNEVIVLWLTVSLLWIGARHVANLAPCLIAGCCQQVSSINGMIIVLLFSPSDSGCKHFYITLPW